MLLLLREGVEAVPTKPTEDPALTLSEARNWKEIAGWILAAVVAIVSATVVSLNTYRDMDARIRNLEQTVAENTGRLEGMDGKLDKVDEISGKIDTVLFLLRADDKPAPVPRK